MHQLADLKRAAKKAPHLCAVAGCRNPKPKKGRVCSRCMMRAWRNKNPIKARFSHLKDSAKRRGIAFMLTLQEFEEFCISTGYHEGSGRTAEELHVDRVEPTRGYSIDNIQVLTCLDNVYKAHYLDTKINGFRRQYEPDPF